MDSLTALAVLPTLLCDIRSAMADTEMPLRSSTLLRRARNMKANVARHAKKLHVDFMNTAIVWKIPGRSSGSGKTMLEFCSPEIAFRFTFYWASTIIANKLLLGLGEDNEALVQECNDSRKHICNSVEHLHSLKPLGALWMTFVTSLAYGVSDDANRLRIVEALKGAYDPAPVTVSPETLQMIFELLTCGL